MESHLPREKRYRYTEISSRSQYQLGINTSIIRYSSRADVRFDRGYVMRFPANASQKPFDKIKSYINELQEMRR